MTALEPRLVRLITRHYDELHGLTVSAQGVFLMCISGVWLLTENPGATFLAVIGLLFPVALVCRWLDRFYAERFGRVTVLQPAWRSRHWLFISMLVAASWLASDLQFLVLWIAVAAQAVWRVIAGWPYRCQEGFVLVAAVSAAVLGGRSQTAHDLAAGNLLVGLAVAISGLADHRLLVRALPPATTRASEESQ